uniref:Nicalin n=1 Tax=Macaca fascicularis TaxID=9541 RepID=A0A7N9C8W8_MACFA
MAAEVLSRRCVLMRRRAVVIILPRAMAPVPRACVRQFMEIEPEMLAMETIVPVYFAVEDEALLSIYEQTQAASASQGSASAAEGGFRAAGTEAVGEQPGHSPAVFPQGRLTGLGGEDLPTIVIVAPLALVAPAYVCPHPQGLDSGSRQSNARSSPARYNLLFFASGGGKFNYQGTKRWLEDNLDHTGERPRVGVGVPQGWCCGEARREGWGPLPSPYPPRQLSVAAHQFPEVRFSMVHKRINLAEDVLAWEHERFAIRRLPAFTLSHLESHRDGQRSSIMDVRSRVDSKTLTRNTRIIAEALTRVIYNLTEKVSPCYMPVFTEQMQIQQEQLDSVMDWLTNQPRAAQLVDKDSTFLSTLEHHLSRYLKDVKQHHVKADKRDPEFVFYDQLKQVMNAYRVKPAVFDLLLAVGIAAYLGMAYVAVQHFSLLYKTVQRLLVKAKTQ